MNVNKRRFRMGAALLLAASLTGAAPARIAGEEYTGSGIETLKFLAAHSNAKAVVISPLSIAYAEAMLADATGSSTRQEIVSALGGTSIMDGAQQIASALQKNPDARVSIANALWTRMDIPPAAAYVSLVRKRYGAQVRALQFGDPSAARAINAWTAAHTNNLIPSIVQSTEPADFAYLTNAIAFDAKWTSPFEKSATRDEPFTPAGGAPHPVPMMHRTGVYSLSNDPSAAHRELRMPYGQGGYAAYFFVPNGTHTADEMLENLGPYVCTNAVRTQPVQVAVTIPKFTAAFRTSLNEALRSEGIQRAFSASGDFSPLHPPPPRLRLSKVDHATYIRVDEAGTVAAAATSAGMSMLAIMQPKDTFVVDRPFVFAICEEHLHVPLFYGIVRDV